MSWYSAGSVTVAVGSTVVVGAGTDFVSNAFAGDAFISQDGRCYEIGQIISATELRLVKGYQGASGGGQAYSIQMTQNYIRELALEAGNLLATFAGVRDGAGQGNFPGGTLNIPGIRFQGDQDTGLINPAVDTLGVVCGGKWSAWFSQTRLMLRGVGEQLNPNNTGVERTYTSLHFLSDSGFLVGGISAYQPTNGFQDSAGLIFATSLGGWAERMRIDAGGNLLVGVTSGARHTIARASSEGDDILYVRNTAGQVSAVFQAVGAGGWQGPAALLLGKNSVNGRSVGAAGTVNASGADYAEYMVKANGCAVIKKGDVCGVDRDGLLTDKWADAISFMVKSTDPSLVGGDTWAAHLGPRPVEPRPEPVAPSASEHEEDEQAACVAYEADHAAWAAESAAYERDLPIYEAALETARQKVDRIAYCGQVPVNMTGPVQPGDYLVAAQDGDGIGVVAVADAAITFDQYRRRVGKVLAIRDGRPWVDVQHG